MQANQKPHFAIVGAGIGGLALAIGLEYRGVSYTIYEAAPEFSAVGLGISFGPNAVRAIELISPEFKKKYDGIATGNKTAGKEHIFCDLWLAEEGFGAKQSWTGVSIGSETYRKSSCHRKDLLAVMKTLVSDDAVEFGKSALEVQQLDDKVQVVFKDGTSVFADAVIGCDGIRSYMRTAVLGNQYSNHLTARYSSRYVYRAVVPMDVAKDALGELAGDGIIFVGQECYLAVVPISHGTQLNILAGRLDDQEWKYEEWTHEVTKAEMLADFRDRCDARILKLLEVCKFEEASTSKLTLLTVGKTCQMGSPSSSGYANLCQWEHLSPWRCCPRIHSSSRLWCGAVSRRRPDAITSAKPSDRLVAS